MARCIDLFIDAPEELDEFAAELAKLTGFAFVLETRPDDQLGVSDDREKPRYLTRKDDVALALAEHDFVDDRHLLFSNYRYDLYARVSIDSPLDSPEAHLLRHALGLVKAEGVRPAMLVFDLQHLIDRADGSPSEAVAT